MPDKLLTFRPPSKDNAPSRRTQLIRNAGIAVFELVKNAYDADASKCVVTMHNLDKPDKAHILIEDDGEGMTYEI